MCAQRIAELVPPPLPAANADAGKPGAERREAPPVVRVSSAAPDAGAASFLTMIKVPSAGQPWPPTGLETVPSNQP